MDDIPGLSEPTIVIRAINRIIGQINILIEGIRDIMTAVDAGAAETGYTFSDNLLTIPTTIKTIEEVWITSGGSKYLFKMKESWYVEKYDTLNTYYMPGRNKIQFAPENTLFNDSALIIEIIGYKTFDKIALSDANISIPETWDEAFVNGVVSKLTLTGKYKDEDIYKNSSSIYSQLLQIVNGWELNRYPYSDNKPAYNYASPGKV